MLSVDDVVQGYFETTFDMWLSITIWHTAGIGFLFLVSGLIASCVFVRRRRVAVCIPVMTTTFGLIVGFCAGALYAIVIALIYDTGSFQMQRFMAAVWGLGLSLFYLVLSIARSIIQW